MTENLPSGAENDPSAPWNTKDLCKYCDIDTLKAIAKDNSLDDYGYEHLFTELYLSTGICRHCKDEETADFRDDD
jgi:hypothetical protein